MRRNGTTIREEILYEIINYFLLHGYAPSLQEIGAAVGLRSTSTVAHHINILLAEGRLETEADARSPRAFRVRNMKIVFNHKEGAEPNGS